MSGPQIEQPNFSDAVPPKPANQGGCAEVHYTDPHESPSFPARAPMDSEHYVDQGLRGYHTPGIGGTGTK